MGVEIAEPAGRRSRRLTPWTARSASWSLSEPDEHAADAAAAGSDRERLARVAGAEAVGLDGPGHVDAGARPQAGLDGQRDLVHSRSLGARGQRRRGALDDGARLRRLAPLQVAAVVDRPCRPPSRRPDPPQRACTISAATEIAVSSGVRAPMSSPIGERQPGQLAVVQAGLAQPGQPVLVGAPRTHGADVAGGRPQRDLQQRHVELRVVGQDADRRALVDPARRELGAR